LTFFPSIQWHRPWQLWWSSLDPSSWASNPHGPTPKLIHLKLAEIYIYMCVFIFGFIILNWLTHFIHIYISVDGYICFSMGQLNSFSLSLKVDPFKIQSKLLVLFINYFFN
jgi:hypothetical protein